MAIEKLAETNFPIHEILRRRWSPRAFSERSIESEKLGSLFEAARWAPSSSNEQPWSFLVARKEDQESFQGLLACLVEGNRVWAQDAPVLMLSVARLTFEETGKMNRHAWHDVGLAVANLVVQATALDLVVHQMAGFDTERARATFNIPEGFEPVTAIAIGYLGNAEHLPDYLREREIGKRSRRPLTEIVFSEIWKKIFCPVEQMIIPI